MGKPVGKNKKKGSDGKGDGGSAKHSRAGEPPAGSPRSLDADMGVFIEMARELKEEGNKLFQKRDYKGAVLTYEKAVKLLPGSHAEVAPLRSNLAACYMHLQPPDYHRAIEHCNLALEVSLKYRKALLKRAKCYEAVDRLDLAVRDVDAVLSSEPSNATALEISERVRKAMESRGVKIDDASPAPIPEPAPAKGRSKPRKKKAQKADAEKEEEAKEEQAKEEPKAGASKVKLVLGEDIRFALIPADCTILQLREIVKNRFPSTEAVLVKYKDEEGDLVTITTTEELRWAENSGDPQGSLRLYITEVSPDQDPLFLSLSDITRKSSFLNLAENGSIGSAGEKKENACVEEWVVLFAQLFKNHVGFGADAYLDLHELGMKLYAEAMESVVASEEAQEIFQLAETKFQELAALALFNWGNVHASRARKAESSFEWARGELARAGNKYEEAIRLKPDFYEGFLALALQQFEQAKLSWQFAAGGAEVMELFNRAEENMEKGTQLWEEAEEQRLRELAAPGEEKLLIQKMGLAGLLKEMSTDEAAEQAANMRSQIAILWGTMLYERSVVEFKLKIPVWEDCLAAAVDKFKLAGASPTDLAVMIKNHCSNATAQEGLGFQIDEIIQAWHEMYDAKRWASGVSSFRLEPLFRRRLPKLHASH